jgi:hypothetical protein
MNPISTASSSETPVIQPSATYQFDPGWRIFLAVVASLLFFGALAVEYRVVILIGTQPVGLGVFLFVVFAVLAATFAWLFAILLTWRVTLRPDALETSSWWTGRRLRRVEIDGCRRRNAGSAGTFLDVVPAVARLKTIRLPLSFMRTDAAFFAWFSGFRDLDLADVQSAIAAVAANADFGATPEQRLRRLALARKAAGALGLLAVAVAAWGLISPQPYPLAIASLAALPALGLILAALSRGLFQIVRWTKNDASLGTVCALPSLTVMLRVLFDLNMVSGVSSLIGPASVGAGIVMSILAVADRKTRSQPAILVICGLIAGIYFFGVIGEANALLDHSPASAVRSQIIDKHVSSGKATTYHFRLAPWGPVTEPSDVSVPHDLYDRLQPGNPVCIQLHSGALDMPWFVVLACR